MKVGIIGITPRQRDSITDLNLAINTTENPWRGFNFYPEVFCTDLRML